MNETNGTPSLPDTHSDKRAWQPPTMEVFDVATSTLFGGPGVYNPADINTYQS